MHVEGFLCTWVGTNGAVEAGMGGGSVSGPSHTRPIISMITQSSWQVMWLSHTHCEPRWSWGWRLKGEGWCFWLWGGGCSPWWGKLHVRPWLSSKCVILWVWVQGMASLTEHTHHTGVCVLTQPGSTRTQNSNWVKPKSCLDSKSSSLELTLSVNWPILFSVKSYKSLFCLLFLYEMQHISKSLQLNLECKDKANSFLFIPGCLVRVWVATNSFSNLTLHVSLKSWLRKAFPWCKLGFTGARLTCSEENSFQMRFENNAAGGFRRISAGISGLRSHVNPIKIFHFVLKDYSFITQSTLWPADRNKYSCFAQMLD